jgi:hypothetical protein
LGALALVGLVTTFGTDGDAISGMGCSLVLATSWTVSGGYARAGRSIGDWSRTADRLGKRLPPSRHLARGQKFLLLCAASEKLRLGSGLGHQCFDRFAAVTVKLESPIGQTAPFAVVADDIVIVGRSLYF